MIRPLETGCDLVYGRGAGRGYVYALYASDCPLQVAYVGQTINPAGRLADHGDGKNTSAWVRCWVMDVINRDAKVCMTILGEYQNGRELNAAEKTWIRFWATFCGLANELGVKDTDAVKESRRKCQQSDAPKFNTRVVEWVHL
jgi:hypothetical protein